MVSCSSLVFFLQPRNPPGSYTTEPFNLALNPSRGRTLTHDHPFSFLKNFNYEKQHGFFLSLTVLSKNLKSTPLSLLDEKIVVVVSFNCQLDTV